MLPLEQVEDHVLGAEAGCVPALFETTPASDPPAVSHNQPSCAPITVRTPPVHTRTKAPRGHLPETASISGRLRPRASDGPGKVPAAPPGAPGSCLSPVRDLPHHPQGLDLQSADSARTVHRQPPGRHRPRHSSKNAARSPPAAHATRKLRSSRPDPRPPPPAGAGVDNPKQDVRSHHRQEAMNENHSGR